MTKRFDSNTLEIQEDIVPTASPSVIFSLISSMEWTPASKLNINDGRCSTTILFEYRDVIGFASSTLHDWLEKPGATFSSNQK